MHNTFYLGLAAVAGILATAWGYFRQFFAYVSSLFIVRITVREELPEAIAMHCWKNMRRISFGTRYFATSNTFVKPKSRWQDVGYEEIGLKPVIFLNKKMPLLLSNRDINGKSLEITYVRGTFDVDKLIVDALEVFSNRTKRQSKRFFIYNAIGSGSILGRKNQTAGVGKSESGQPLSNSYKSDITNGDVRVVGWKPDHLGYVEDGVNFFDNLAITDDAEIIIEEIVRWKQSEKWFKAKGIKWTRGLCLSGKPGTGKSSLVKAIGQKVDIPIWIFDLSSMSNDEFLKEWDSVLSNSPAIVLFEDIDTVFNGRTNILGQLGGGLTFDCLLNAMSGVKSADGIITVITTNCIDKLDEALGKPSGDGMQSTRPGRIDRVFELKELNKDQRIKIANRILCDFPEEIDAIVAAGDGDVGAQFSERCCQIALRLFWEDKTVRAIDRVEKPFGNIAPKPDSKVEEILV